MDDYCKNHEKDDIFFCHKINRRVPQTFCGLACCGNWKKWWHPDIEEARTLARKPLTDEQLADKDLVSVIIPCRDEPNEHINKSIKSLLETAIGSIEIMIGYDSLLGGTSNRYFNLIQRSGSVALYSLWPTSVGQRVIVNYLAKEAKGKYLFRLDGHCAMSHGWDARLKSSCKGDTIVVSVFDGLNPDTWEPVGKDLAFCILNPNLRKHFVRNWKPVSEREVEEEMMTFTGTAWMIRKDYYWQLGGHDETLGGFGAIGAEWALKTWLTGGRVLLRTDVVCYHYFKRRTEYEGDPVRIEAAFQRLRKQWIDGEDERITRPFEWLYMKFEKYLKNGFSYRKRTRKREVQVVAPA